MRVAGAAAGAVMVLPAAAQAHGSLPGTGGFAAGLLHPLLATEQAVLLVSLGLLAGAVRAAGPAAGLVLGLVAGLLLRWALPGMGPQSLTVVTLGFAVTAGAVAALGSAGPLAKPGAAAGALVAGLVVGLGTDLPPSVGPVSDATGALAAVAGTITGALLIMLNAAAFARSPIGAGPGRRVAGSWIVAAAVLMLAFSLRTAQVAT